MKLLVDMNLSPRWVQFLEAAGFNAIHWASVGSHDAPDVVIMGYAAARAYVVLTHDLDFGAMLAASRSAGPSVVQVRADDVRPETIGPVVIASLRQMEVELARGALVTVDPVKARARILPFVRGDAGG